MQNSYKALIFKHVGKCSVGVSQYFFSRNSTYKLFGTEILGNIHVHINDVDVHVNLNYLSPNATWHSA